MVAQRTAVKLSYPPKGEFERMARRRFQNRKPTRRGEWWTVRVWKTTFTSGQLKRTRERIRLAPASRGAREEYLSPLNQELENIGSAINFQHYVETTYPSCDAQYGKEHAGSVRQELSDPGLGRPVFA